MIVGNEELRKPNFSLQQNLLKSVTPRGLLVINQIEDSSGRDDLNVHNETRLPMTLVDMSPEGEIPVAVNLSSMYSTDDLAFKFNCSTRHIHRLVFRGNPKACKDRTPFSLA